MKYICNKRRCVFEMSWPRKESRCHILRQRKICKLMNNIISLCGRKVPTRTPSPAWETSPEKRRLLSTPCSEDRRFLQKKMRLGRYNLLQRRTQSVFWQYFSFWAFFFLSFVSLDLKWIIQSVSHVHVRLHQFDFCLMQRRGERIDGMWHALYLEYYLSVKECGEMKP